MERAIFFEKEGGFLHKCFFAGLDSGDKPQWVMVDQGEDSKLLDDYTECCEYHPVLLCMEGDTVETSTMTMLLGSVLRGCPVDMKKAMLECLQSLRRSRVEWNHGDLDVHVKVIHVEKNDYRLLIYDCENSYLCLKFLHGLKEAMNIVRIYADTLYRHAGITLNMHLIAGQNLDEEQLDDHDRMMFNEISKKD